MNMDISEIVPSNAQEIKPIPTSQPSQTTQGKVVLIALYPYTASFEGALTISGDEQLEEISRYILLIILLSHSCAIGLCKFHSPGCLKSPLLVLFSMFDEKGIVANIM